MSFKTRRYVGSVFTFMVVPLIKISLKIPCCSIEIYWGAFWRTHHLITFDNLNFISLVKGTSSGSQSMYESPSWLGTKISFLFRFRENQTPWKSSWDAQSSLLVASVSANCSKNVSQSGEEKSLQCKKSLIPQVRSRLTGTNNSFRNDHSVSSPKWEN